MSARPLTRDQRVAFAAETINSMRDDYEAHGEADNADFDDGERYLRDDADDGELMDEYMKWVVPALEERTSDAMTLTCEHNEHRPGTFRAKIVRAPETVTYVNQWAWNTPQDAIAYARLVWAGRVEGLRNDVITTRVPAYLEYAMHR